LKTIEKFSLTYIDYSSGADTSVPMAAWAYGDILRKNDPRSQLEIITGAGHTFANLEHTNRVISLTTGWFKKYLFQKN